MAKRRTVAFCGPLCGLIQYAFVLHALSGVLVHAVQCHRVEIYAGNGRGDHLGVALAVQREDNRLLQND